MNTPDYILGLDLGQANDFSALVVLEVSRHKTDRVKPQVTYDLGVKMVPVYENHYAVRHLERLPKGTPYTQQVARVKEIHDHLAQQMRWTPRGSRLEVVEPRPVNVALVVDQTGVGRPVVDMLRDARLHPIGITITGGDNVTRDGYGYRVPKRDLVTTVQVLLQAGRIKIAASLPLAQTLIDELVGFKVAISASGHDSYGNDAGWREAPHDDLVLAVALACWWGEQR